MQGEAFQGMTHGGDREAQASLLKTAIAVVSAFFGVRKRSDHDSVRLNPVHVIVVGVIAAALFVITLLLIVRTVTS